MLLERSDGKPTLLYPYYIYPLPILKQIISLFLSVNSPKLQQRYPNLSQFVLNKEERYLNPRYRFFTYYNTGGRIRRLPLARKLDILTGQYEYLSEITTFPFGYVMTIDSSSTPDNRLFDISHFSRYEYEEFTALTLRFPVLPTHTILHGDYRTKDEVNRTAEESQLADEDEESMRKEELMRKLVGSPILPLLTKLLSPTS
jgi:hypothetical protein